MKPLYIGGKCAYLPDMHLLVDNELIKTIEKAKFKEVIVENLAINCQSLSRDIIKLDHIVFEVTQSCNMACKYCVYGGNYFYERNRSDSHIKIETAKKGLQYIFNLIKERDKKEFNIGMYGGEPFLEFQAIKKIVSYSRYLFRKWKLKFNVTTNGTIMNDEIINFIVSEDFHVLISLDGPKNNHDSKRIYTNGEGTFETVVKNMEKIKSYSPLFFKNNISLSVVLSLDLPLNDTFDFFTNNELVNGLKIRASTVNIKGTCYYTKYPTDFDKFTKAIGEIKNRIKRKIKEKSELRPIEHHIFKKFIDVDDELNQRHFNYLTGCCHFNNKLFISVDGKFHICERINNNFPIGDVDGGFNFFKMKNIMEEFIQIKKTYCENCEVRFFCLPCYVSFAKDGIFEIDKNFCHYVRTFKMEKLRSYIDFNLSQEVDLPFRKSQYSFHQFVKTERGHTKTAIFDFLKGNIYQVENTVIDKFLKGIYDKEVTFFIKNASSEELIIPVSSDMWIPRMNKYRPFSRYEKQMKRLGFILEIEEGINLELIKSRFASHNVSQILYFGSKKVKEILPGVQVEYCKKNFDLCVELCEIDGNFGEINEDEYYFNIYKNSCWGNKIAVTKEGKLRPCIHSEIVLGDLRDINISQVLIDIKPYWFLTKDKIEKCKICEFRYACFDCREIPLRKNGSLYSSNPYCSYNPLTGKWESSQNNEEDIK